MITKTCIKCDVEKNINNFSFRKDTNKYRNCCKRCENERKNQWKKQKFENHEWKIQLKELECGTCKNVKPIECFSRRKDTELGVRKTCKDCRKKYNNEYFKNNYNDLRKYQNEYRKQKRVSNPEFKLASNLRTRLNEAFKAQDVSKNNKTFELISCSQKFLKDWIENQLYGDMNIENYGIDFVLDHTVPIASFNLFNEDELRKCFNWKNLRPMRPKENISKGSKVDERLYLLQEIKAHYFEKLNGETTD